MALQVTNSPDVQDSTTSTYSLQQSGAVDQAPTSNAPAVSPADQDKLLTLLHENADNSSTTPTGNNSHFVQILVLTGLVAVAIVLLFVYQRLALKFLKR